MHNSKNKKGGFILKDFEDEDLIEDDDFEDLEEIEKKSHNTENETTNSDEKNNNQDWRTYNVKEKNKFAFYILIFIVIGILTALAILGFSFGRNLTKTLNSTDSSIESSISIISESEVTISSESISIEESEATSEIAAIIESIESSEPIVEESSSEVYEPEKYTRVIDAETEQQQVDSVNQMLSANPVMTEESPDAKTLARLELPNEERDWDMIYLTGGQFVWWVENKLATYEGVKKASVFPKDNKVTLYGDIEKLKGYESEVVNMFKNCDLGLDNDSLTFEIVSF
jgi:hypothetical protein